MKWLRRGGWLLFCLWITVLVLIGGRWAAWGQSPVVQWQAVMSLITQMQTQLNRIQASVTASSLPSGATACQSLQENATAQGSFWSYLTGDLSSGPGSCVGNTQMNVTVKGFNGVPLSATAPTNGQGYFFNSLLNQFVPQSAPNNLVTVTMAAPVCASTSDNLTACQVNMTSGTKNFTIVAGSMPCPLPASGLSISIYDAGTGVLNQQGNAAFAVHVPLTTTVASCSDTTHGTTVSQAGNTVTASPTIIAQDNLAAINAQTNSGNPEAISLQMASGATTALAYISNAIHVTSSNTTIYLNGVHIISPWMDGMVDSSGTNAFDPVLMIGGSHANHLQNMAIIGPGIIDGSCGVFTAVAGGSVGSVSEQNFCNDNNGGCDPQTAIYQPSTIWMKFVDHVTLRDFQIRNTCAMGATAFEDAQYITLENIQGQTIGADFVHIGETYTAGDSVSHWWCNTCGVSNNSDDGIACEGGYDQVNRVTTPTTDGHINHFTYTNPNTAYAQTYFNDGLQFTGDCESVEVNDAYIQRPPEVAVQLVGFNGGSPQHIHVHGGHFEQGLIGFSPIQLSGRAAGSTSAAPSIVPFPTIGDFTIDGGADMFTGGGVVLFQSTLFQGRAKGVCVSISGQVTNVDIGGGSRCIVPAYTTGALTQAFVGNFQDDIQNIAPGSAFCASGPGNCFANPPDTAPPAAGSTHRTNIHIHNVTMDTSAASPVGGTIGVPPTMPTPFYIGLVANADVPGDSYYIDNNFVAGLGGRNFTGNGSNPFPLGGASEFANLVPDPQMTIPSDWSNVYPAVPMSIISAIGGDGSAGVQLAGTNNPFGNSKLRSKAIPVVIGQVYTQGAWMDFTAGTMTQANQNGICFGVFNQADDSLVATYGFASSQPCELPGHKGFQMTPIGPMTTSLVYFAFNANSATVPAGQTVTWSNPILVASPNLTEYPAKSVPITGLQNLGAISSLIACGSATESLYGTATDCNAGCSAAGTCTTGGTTHCEVRCNGTAYVETGR